MTCFGFWEDALCHHGSTTPLGVPCPCDAGYCTFGTGVPSEHIHQSMWCSTASECFAVVQYLMCEEHQTGCHPMHVHTGALQHTPPCSCRGTCLQHHSLGTLHTKWLSSGCTKIAVYGVFQPHVWRHCVVLFWKGHVCEQAVQCP